MSGQAEAPGRATTAADGAEMEPAPPSAAAAGDAAQPWPGIGETVVPGDDGSSQAGAGNLAPPHAGGVGLPAEGHADPVATGAEARSVEVGTDAGEPADPARVAEGARIAEALIFASDRPVTPAMLGAVLPPGVTPGAVVAALAEACEGRGVLIAEVAGGWAFRTAPDLAQRLTKVVQAPRRLPRAAMEALSIIAYHQPCTRGEIEEIRGAALAQTTLEALLELGLVSPRGRREVPGRPTLWGTTPKFLEQFGLKALSDLPRKEELVTAETGPALPLGGAAQAPVPPADDAPEQAAEPELDEPTGEPPVPGTVEVAVSDADTQAGAAP